MNINMKMENNSLIMCVYHACTFGVDEHIIDTVCQGFEGVRLLVIQIEASDPLQVMLVL